MKKLLISILMILIMVGLFFTIKDGFSVVNFDVESWKALQELDTQTTTKIAEAKKITSQDYEETIKKLNTSIQTLNKVKTQYESQMVYSEDGTLAGITIKQHKIEHLWTTLGLYADNNNVDLSFDVSKLNTGNEMELYNLQFTILGSYTNTTSFISDIIKDDSLSFDISNFNMVPNGTTTVTVPVQQSTTTESSGQEIVNENTGNTTTQVSYTVLKTTFSVQNIGIQFN